MPHTAEQIAAAFAAGRRTHANLALTSTRFAAYVADKHPEALLANASDSFLACACADHDAEALAIFDRQFLSSLAVQLGCSAEFADEVAQQLRVLLFSGPRPRIADYRGQGALGGFVRIAALRIASNLRRQRGIKLPAAGTAEPISDPDLILIERRYRAHFEHAMRDALAALSTRDRNLLRLHLGHGVTLDRLAVMYNVHRATVARWLKDARARVVEDVQSRLVAALPASPTEIQSLARLLRSRLDVNLSSWLGRAEPQSEG